MVSGECPRIAPVGYLNISDPVSGKSTVILDPIRSQFIKQIFEMYARGNTSLSDLVRFAAKYNITNTFFKGSKKTLCKNVIGNLLKNPFYYGAIYSAKLDKYYPHKYEPLIDEILFVKCQDVRFGRKTVKYKRTMKPFTYRGLIKCHHCGCS